MRKHTQELSQIMMDLSPSNLTLAGEALVHVSPTEFKSWAKVFRNEKPKIINFQVNDICNSKCVMCHIWTKKRDNEISPAAFKDLLQQPFFSEVEHLGITGGEPTLRDDLFQFYDIALNVLTNLKGASFITNGFLTDKAIHLYSQIFERYQAQGLSFAGMVSIDGVGDVHDRVRGVAGAYLKATRTLLGLREKGVPVIACCTIVKENVYGLHDLLQWGRDHDVYIRFRVAEFINRLYNTQLVEQIRNFDQYEIRHLVSFFHLLLTEYETDEQIKRTYTSILSILTGGNRLIRCPYQSSFALNIDSQERFAHCAPKGTPHPLGLEAGAAVQQQKLERLDIRRQHCSSCIHDYHADWSGWPAWLAEVEPSYDQKIYAIDERDFPRDDKPAEPVDLKQLRKILLVGWYGTETAGDIAILSGILREYLAVNPQLSFILFSLYPFYTKLTLSEMDNLLARHVTVRPYHGVLAWQAIEACQAVVMAGGPLMDIPQTRLIASIFLLFRNRGKRCMVEGCGIGPLNVEEYRHNVTYVARLASKLSVRDRASKDLLKSFGIHKEIIVRDDPSRTFVRSTNIRHTGTQKDVIRCFLRELTQEYPQAILPEAATHGIVQFLTNLLDWYPNHHIELWPMHYFPVGNDDRAYARRLAAAVNSNRLTIEYRPRLPEEILQAMATADFNICMRFHSVVFASTIEAPFAAIDYTAGGKVHNYLTDTAQSFRGITLEQVAQLDKSSFVKMLTSSPGNN
jgi:polysaccharide pyruvyl transferase WcaK-like protein/MoaA/NifB/PqqE/SkfB family radical SAM enzyme